MGRHFYFLMSFQSVFRGLRQGLAKENTAAQRGRFSFSQPLWGMALYGTRGTGLPLQAGNENAAVPPVYDKTSGFI